MTLIEAIEKSKKYLSSSAALESIERSHLKMAKKHQFKYIIYLCALGKATSSQCEQSHNDNEAHQGNLTNGALYRVLQARRKRRPIVEQLE